MDKLDLTNIVTIVISIFYLLILGAVVRRHGFRERAGRLLAPYILISGLLEVARVGSRMGWFAFLTDAGLTKMILYGTLALAMLFLHMSRAFLQLKGPGWSWLGLGTGWMILLILLQNNLLTLPEGSLTNELWLDAGRGSAFGALLLGWGMLMVIAVFSTIITYSRMHQPLHRNRIAYWIIAATLITGGGVLFFAITDIRYEPFSSGFHLMGTVCAAYAILTHRLFDVRQSVRRVASYLIGTVLMIALYTGAFLTADYIFQTMPGYAPWMVGVALALVLSLLFDPILRLIRRLVERLFMGVGYSATRTLRQYSTGISNILDLEQLATVAVGLISEALEIRHGSLFVVHYEEERVEGEGDHFHLRGARGMGAGEDLLPSILSATSPVADYLRQEHVPLTQYDVDLHPRFREMVEAEKEWLVGLHADVYVPIYAKGEWIGFLALGPKQSGDRYFDDELVLLSTLADQTAVALENARLFDDLKARTAEIEHLNEDLAEANRELIRMGQAKSDFIDIASHELRTPLTQVRGYTDILKEMIETDSLSAKGGAKLTRGLKKAAERLEEIINTMFDVAQIDTATLELTLFPESVASIVKDSVETWAEALEERNLTLTTEDLEGLPSIFVDFKRIKQVFSHLIQNAIKYTPDGGEIRITGQMMEWTLPQDQKIEIVIADTGIGIAHDDLERIFEKFYRVGDVLLHSTGKTKFKGAGPGLGLTIARGIVKAHGGRIWATSPGYDEETCPGGEFHIVLPVHPQSLESDDRALVLTG